MPRHNHPHRKHRRRPFGPPRSRRAPVRQDDSAHGEVQHEHHDRLQKVLASAGIASRRECEQLILEGRVEVDHQVVTELGTRVDPQRQEIRVDGEALPRPKLVYFAVNKPTGVVSTARDPAGRPRVTDLLPPNTPRVFCVGRLDITTEGLILVTNDGELANGLTHPRHGVEKIYHVQVAGQVERDVLAQLHRGIHLAEGFAHAKHVRIKSRRKRSTILEMVLDEGRNREVRRLLARVGHKVQRLKRIAVGPVRLGDLPVGAVRSLSPKEIHSLEQAVLRGGKSESTAHHDEAKPSTPRPAKKKSHRDHRVHIDSRTVIGD
jgi:23S rRNA pseudouridine2605 synthase